MLKGAELEPAPKVFEQFSAGYWGIPAPLTKALWQAFRRPAHPTPRALRHAWLLYDGVQGMNPGALIHWTCSPRKVIESIEALVDEQLLTRRQATEAEEAILAHVYADGTWR